MIITECVNTKCNAPIEIGWELGNGYGWAHHECKKCGTPCFVELTGIHGVTLDEKSFHERFPSGQHGTGTIKRLASRKDYKALATRWEKNILTTKWITDNKGTFFRLLWWSLFKRYRIIYFIELCGNGMAHEVAWRDSKKRPKAECFKFLTMWGWR